MLCWDTLVKEWRGSRETALLSLPGRSVAAKSVPPGGLKYYALGDAYPNIHFTPREAQCMVLLIRGQTMKTAARCLQLSPRTVEYYVRNMRIKLQCSSKAELIDRVMMSDFAIDQVLMPPPAEA